MIGMLEDRRTVTAVALSPMQRELLRHLADGLTGAQSARRFGIPRYGVSNRLVTLYAALGAGSAARAVARAHEFGLLARTPQELPPLDTGRRDLLRAIARGDTDTEIASRLRVHVSRVRHRLADLYREIGAKNRPSAVHLAYCGGLFGKAVRNGG